MSQKQCSKCKRQLPLYQFESKGVRAGRQVKRGVCIDCRTFKRRMRKPVHEEDRRQCVRCKRSFDILKFDVCGYCGLREYRKRRCHLCRNAEHRKRYALRIAPRKVRPHKPYKQYEYRIVSFAP